MKLAFDIDGVLAELRPGELELIRRLPKQKQEIAEMAYYDSLRPLLDAREFVAAGDEPCIITARPSRLQGVTRRWLYRYYPGWKIHFLGDVGDWKPGEDPRLVVAQAKAKKLEELQVELYFEDDPVIVRELRRIALIPVIVQFGGRV